YLSQTELKIKSPYINQARLAPPSHHLLKLLKINIPITVSINITDHPTAVLQRALLSQSLQHGVQFTRRNQTILVSVIHVERLPKLFALGSARAVVVPAGVELGELVDVDIAVAVCVDFGHYPLNLVGRRVGAESPEKRAEFAAGDFTVSIGVESVEDELYVVRSVSFCVFVRHWRNRERRQRKKIRSCFGFC
ncbi:hypothetical protein RJ641_023153, partial [Dillenia turbinata]